MKTFARICLLFAAALTQSPAGQIPIFDPIAEAARHPIIFDRPSVNINEGGILGNGDMGAVVTAMPDAVLIHFGNNAVWDQRMAEVDMKKLGTFQETLKRILAIPPDSVKVLSDDPWFKQYQEDGRASYKNPYPRPLSCGALALGFDRRKAEVLGHRVRIERGLCEVDFLIEGKTYVLEVFMDMDANRLWGRMVDAEGKPAAAPFSYIALLPDRSIPAELPRFTRETVPEQNAVSFRQILPFEEILETSGYKPNPKDRAFRLTASTNAAFDAEAEMPRGVTLGSRLRPVDQFCFRVDFSEGLASAISDKVTETSRPDIGGYEKAAHQSATAWRDYWSKSGVALNDQLLEEVWYWNTYFLRCALRPGTKAPGLYAITPWPNKPTAWHGDYHMDYNTEQAFWSTFSSNHPDLHLPYAEMVQAMLPTAKAWARDYYQMRGAYFPVSAYPVEMRGYPYPPPVFNWMVGVSSWWVQSLWWHYRYTMDEQFLKEKAFDPIRSVALFMIDYINRPDVKEKKWGDDKAHIYPSFPPELYHLKPGLPAEYNADTLVDLTLSRFVFQAYLQACKVLKLEQQEAANIKDVREILARMVPYPTGDSQYGKVFLSVPAENPEAVHNVPVSLMTVFPGEDHGLHSSPEDFAVAANTYRNQQNEGGNEVVFLNLQAARLGLLDLEKFKRQIRYTRMPNGSCTNKNLQIGGRFSFGPREYDWMAYFGIWFENFSLPAVINECLLQGYNDELRFFPNWPREKDAEFRTLRTAGAFLVSARHAQGKVQWIEIQSEAGGPLTIISPWKEGAISLRDGKRDKLTGDRFTIDTRKGDRVLLTASEP